ncbi:MAG: hypothetical protein EBQ92_03720 [Proteobacteria bacterium]|nr:hypothetical protein [Pseudomonadota bacterium]
MEGAAGRGAPDLDRPVGDCAGRLVPGILREGDADRGARGAAGQGEHHEVRARILDQQVGAEGISGKDSLCRPSRGDGPEDRSERSGGAGCFGSHDWKLGVRSWELGGGKIMKDE